MSEKKVKRHEYLILIGFMMLVFFGGMLDSDNMMIPAAGVIVSCLMMGVATWLYYRR